MFLEGSKKHVTPNRVGWIDIHLFYKYFIPLGFLAMVLRNRRLSGVEARFFKVFVNYLVI